MRTWISVALLSAVALLAVRGIPAGATPRTLRVLTHSSFSASKEIIAAFERENDARVQFIAGGDAGETLNKAILARGNPFADVLFGVDNTFLGRALAAEIFEPYPSPLLAEIPRELDLDTSHRLLPVDFGYVTLNYDRKFFAGKSLPVPRSLAELALPVYRGLLVVENPATSSPGLAFLLATIAAFGETGTRTWESYWGELRRNDLLVVNGWNEAYYGEFSATGKGKRPLVVSYATSPAAEIFYAAEPKPVEPPTGNIVLEGGSFRQIEFVGILRGGRERDLAQRFIDFLLSPAFQSDIPLQMWVYPASVKAPLPDIFRAFAAIPSKPAVLEAQVIDARREEWIRKWTRIVLK